MASLNIVQTGVEKASKVSPRQGKWATPKEIDLKTSPKQTPLQATLAQLVKDARIEKKAGMLLYRPQQGAGGGGEGKGHKERGDDRGKERGKDRRKERDGRDKGKDRRRDDRKPDSDRERRNKIEQDRERRRREAAKKNKAPRKTGRRDLTKTVARGVGTQAVAGGLGQSVSRNITSTILS